MAKTFQAKLARARAAYTGEVHQTALDAVNELGTWHGALPDAAGEQQALEALALVVLCETGLIDQVTAVSPRADRIYLTADNAAAVTAALLSDGDGVGIPWLLARKEGSGLDLYRHDQPGLIHVRHAARHAPKLRDWSTDVAVRHAATERRLFAGLDVVVASRTLRRIGLFPPGQRARLATRLPDEATLAGPHPRIFVPRERPPTPPMIGWYGELGGVGVTDTVMQVARALADTGRDILVVDLDRACGPLARDRANGNPRVPTQLYLSGRGGKVSARYVDPNTVDIHLAEIVSAGRYDLVLIDAGSPRAPRLRDARELDHTIVCLLDLAHGSNDNSSLFFESPAEELTDAEDDVLDEIEDLFQMWLDLHTTVPAGDRQAQDTKWWRDQENGFVYDPATADELRRRWGDDAPAHFERWKDYDPEAEFFDHPPEPRSAAETVALIGERMDAAGLPRPTGIVACRTSPAPPAALVDDVAAALAPAFLAVVPECLGREDHTTMARMTRVHNPDGVAFNAAIDAVAGHITRLIDATDR